MFIKIWRERMKRKLRELRRKREFVRLCKGALRKSYLVGVKKISYGNM